MQDLKGATKANVTVSLGMLNFVASIHAAVGDEESLPTKTLCLHHEHPEAGKPSPIKAIWRCPECESEVRKDFVKGFEGPEGWEPIPAETIEAQVAEADEFKNIELLPHPVGQVTDILVPSGKAYYLNVKNKANAQAYAILAETIRKHPDLAFMSKFAQRTVTYLVQLTVAGDGTLVLTQMVDTDLVRKHPVIEFEKPRKEHLRLAGELVKLMVTDFVADQHGQGRSTIIADYVAARQAREALSASVFTPVAAAGPVDMTSQLEAIVAAAAQAKAEAEAVKEAS